MKKLFLVLVSALVIGGTVFFAHAALEDAQHVSGDGTLDGANVPMTVRSSTAAALAGSNNDYQPLITDANGNLYVIQGGVPAGTTSVTVQAGTVAISNIAAGTVAISNIAAGTVAISSLTNIGGTVAHYYSTANANLINWDGTTGRTFAEFAIKASPGAIKSVECDGTVNNELSYLTLYDLAAGPVTVGTTQPTLQLTCGGGTIGVGILQMPTIWNFGDSGIGFTTAITGAVCKNRACSSDVDVAVPITIIYK